MAGIRMNLRRSAAAAGAVIIASFAGLAVESFHPPNANAVPGQCGAGYGAGSGGGFCDSDAWPDGSFYHCAHVYVLGFGGGGCGRVCPNPQNPALPIATDADPNTHC
ncbi:hypothetical protein MSP7336_00559 [Mycobacterium shimoidei]|uniref:Uncharacterized protein n=1 Tax=Mycobacterium shimoidei TaxID=29313 RepID=A0A375YTT6_MYCSH|nr:hypothetical protein MSP7336_00559 [Mycobacterium shimoidei]